MVKFRLKISEKAANVYVSKPVKLWLKTPLKNSRKSDSLKAEMGVGGTDKCVVSKEVRNCFQSFIFLSH